MASENKGLTVSPIMNQPIAVLPLRDVVVYPYMVIPLFVGRKKSIRALEKAMQDDKQILLVAQKNAEVDEPTGKDIHRVGVLATLLQMLKLPDGTVKVLVEGGRRARIIDLIDDEYFTAEAELIDEGDDYDER